MRLVALVLAAAPDDDLQALQAANAKIHALGERIATGWAQYGTDQEPAPRDPDSPKQAQPESFLSVGSRKMRSLDARQLRSADQPVTEQEAHDAAAATVSHLTDPSLAVVSQGMDAEEEQDQALSEQGNQQIHDGAVEVEAATEQRAEELEEIDDSLQEAEEDCDRGQEALEDPDGTEEHTPCQQSTVTVNDAQTDVGGTETITNGAAASLDGVTVPSSLVEASGTAQDLDALEDPKGHFAQEVQRVKAQKAMFHKLHDEIEQERLETANEEKGRHHSSAWDQLLHPKRKRA